MKKNVFITLISAALTFVSLTIINKKRRTTMSSKLRDRKLAIKLRNNTHFPIHEAGDPSCNCLENTNMISEGSQYGVDFYNRVKQ